MILNPLTAKDRISSPLNLTILWSWILRWVPGSVSTHAPLCNTLSSHKNKKMSKIVKILAVKGLIITELLRVLHFYFLPFCIVEEA